MDQTTRQTPAIPDRAVRPIPLPQFGPVIQLVEVALEQFAFIPFRVRHLSELQVPQADLTFPAFADYRFVETPAAPVITFRYGQPPLLDPQAFVSPAYQRFPYVSTTPPAPANPVIAFRYGRDLLVDLQALARSAYYRFPYAPSVRAFVQFRYGQDILRSPVAIVAAHYQAFPYVSAAVAAPANPVVGFRYGQPRLDAALVFPDPHFHRFPYPSPTPPTILTKCWEFRMADNGTLSWVEVPCLPCLPVDDTDDCGGGAPSGPVGVC